MNPVGLVQCRWLPNFAQGPLRSYFDEQQKNEIHLKYLYFVFTSFLFIICDIFILMLQINGEEKF